MVVVVLLVADGGMREREMRSSGMNNVCSLAVPWYGMKTDGQYGELCLSVPVSVYVLCV